MSYKNKLTEYKTWQTKMANEINLGVENQEFVLYYQPLFHLQRSEVIGMEALVRWIHPKKGLISPDIFISVAEQTKEIYKLEQWIFKKALEQKRQWEAKGFQHLEMSINLSSITLANEAAFREIAAIISSSQVDYTKLIIEITETASLLNMENVLKWLDQLKRMGIRIALDDFGTGYSTLSLLNHLPIDVIKIDKSFVNMIANDKKDRLIIKNTISMAHDLNCRVVAEGIETLEQLEFLKESFCESGQGYLLCMPLPEDKVSRYLRRCLPS